MAQRKRKRPVRRATQAELDKIREEARKRAAKKKAAKKKAAKRVGRKPTGARPSSGGSSGGGGSGGKKPGKALARRTAMGRPTNVATRPVEGELIRKGGKLAKGLKAAGKVVGRAAPAVGLVAPTLSNIADRRSSDPEVRRQARGGARTGAPGTTAKNPRYTYNSSNGVTAARRKWIKDQRLDQTDDARASRKLAKKATKPTVNITGGSTGSGRGTSPGRPAPAKAAASPAKKKVARKKAAGRIGAGRSATAEMGVTKKSDLRQQAGGMSRAEQNMRKRLKAEGASAAKMKAELERLRKMRMAAYGGGRASGK